MNGNSAAVFRQWHQNFSGCLPFVCSTLLLSKKERYYESTQKGACSSKHVSGKHSTITYGNSQQDDKNNLSAAC